MRQDICFEEAPYCAVGKSRLCDGQGLFALKKFTEGEIVVNYSANYELWSLCKFEEIPKFYKEYMWWVGVDKNVCKLADSSSLFMRANHNSTPNTEWFIEQKVLVAKQVIFPGEEITYNYRKEIAPDNLKSNPPSWI